MQEYSISKAPGKEKLRAKKYNLYREIVVRILSGMYKGRLDMYLPEGEKLSFGKPGSKIRAEIRVNNTQFFRKCVLFGDIGFGESYVDGDWDTGSITNVISWLLLNIDNAPEISGGRKKFSAISLLKVINKYYHNLNQNTPSGSRKNIAAHYDLNNDFFGQFLDKSMTYSSAIFKTGSQSLQDAQENKYDRLCRKLKLKESDHVLEIGSGWGGFAVYAAKNYKCRITTVTISEEQFEFAKKKIREENLTGKIEIKLMDYRMIEGRFDKIVSIEMLEAVGHKFLPRYFEKCNELLAKNGVLALQVITSPDSRYDSLRKGVDWIQKHIFPGSLLPSIAEINRAVNMAGDMHLHDLKNFGLHYAKTLSIWRDNFNNGLNKIFDLGFDEEFGRKWNYYFSYCEAAFRMRNISVVQMIYTRPNNLSL